MLHTNPFLTRWEKTMMQGLYLLGVEQIEKRKETLYAYIPEGRRQKADRMESSKGRLLSLGAGFLISYIRACYRRETEALNRFLLSDSDLETMLAFMEPEEYELVVGDGGKPAFGDIAVHFSLSHSGDYVLFAFGDEQVGCDIQRQEEKDFQKLADRFYSPKEAGLIADSESKRELFFDLWTKKEALGKCLGTGVVPVLSKEFALKIQGGGFFVETRLLEGPEDPYSIAVIRERTVGK